MTGPLRKRKAAASPAGNRPGQSRRGAPPPNLEAPAPSTALSGLIVHTRERRHMNVAHKLRGRTVFVPYTHAPPEPITMILKKGEKPVYDLAWLAATCAKVALKCYNRLNEDEHELVKAVDCATFFFNGPWMHANFLAKSKGATPDLAPKYFFAELKIGPRGIKKMSCLSCTKMDPGLVVGNRAVLCRQIVNHC